MKHTLIVMMGCSGVGKAQPVDTIIPTPNGYKTLGDISVGDYVFDKRGKPTEVLGVFPQGKLDTYEVVLTDGRKTQCSDEHLWTYFSNKGKIHTETLKDMMKKSIRENPHKDGTLGRCRYHIPRHKCVEYDTKNFDIHPYIVGAFLGDGCCLEKPLTISSSDEEIPQRIAELLPFECEAFKNSQNNYNWNFRLKNPYMNDAGHSMVKNAQTKEVFKNFSDTLCCYSYQKRIPEQYLYGDREQRLELLRGLLDTDGNIQERDGRFTITIAQTSYELMKDIAQLVESLGYKIGKICEDNRKEKYTSSCYYTTITAPNQEKEQLFYLSRKKEIAIKAKEHKQKINWDKVGISEVNNLHIKKEMVCILVDNEEHLYLTNDFIVTHNTYLARFIANTHEDCVIVSRDAIRFAMLKKGEDYFAHEDEVIKHFYQNISDALRVHKYVIADATHLSVKARNRLFSNISMPFGTRIIGVWIETSLKTALRQNAARTGLARVPEDVIRRMFKTKVSPRKDEPFDEVIFISRDSNVAIGSASPTIEEVYEKLAAI